MMMLGIIGTTKKLAEQEDSFHYMLLGLERLFNSSLVLACGSVLS